MKLPANPRTRGALGMGIAFIIGATAFLAAYKVAQYMANSAGEALLPADKRLVGTLEMPLLSADPAAPPWKIADQKGKVVLVNYFATWCGPCMAELPDMKALAKEYGAKGVVFVAVSLDQDDERAKGTKREEVLRQFVKDREFSLPILLPRAEDPIWRIAFPIPQTYLYDKQGRVARSLVGGIAGQGVDKSLDELLKEP